MYRTLKQKKMIQLENPKNQKAEVLFYLIKEDFITYSSIYYATGIINLNARISNLRLDHNLIIPCTSIKSINKHGRDIQYGSWKLINKELGIEIYKKLNKEN